MRDVNYGWLIRYMHANGASMFFIAVYIHMFRGMYYGSYKAPREVLWMIGVLIYLVMMATAFMGYVLPWGQMSFWGAKVITNLFSAIPFVGDADHHLAVGRLRGRQPDARTASSRCTTCCPSCWPRLVGLHIWALHVPGNNNPTGVSVKGSAGHAALPPLLHDEGRLRDRRVPDVLRGLGLLRARTIWAMPSTTRWPTRWSTPAHIVPEWYYLPFYAILRAMPDKLGGVIAMFGSILILFALPWLDTSKVRSGNYRPLFKGFFWIFVVVCIALGYLGSKPAEGALCDLVADPDGLLLRALPGDPAAARTARKPEAAAGVHFRRACSPRTTATPPCLPSDWGIER